MYIFTGHFYTQDILDIPPHKTKKGKQNKRQKTWEKIDPFVKPYVKSKKGISRAELYFLFHTE